MAIAHRKVAMNTRMQTQNEIRGESERAQGFGNKEKGLAAGTTKTVGKEGKPDEMIEETTTPSRRRDRDKCTFQRERIASDEATQNNQWREKYTGPIAVTKRLLELLGVAQQGRGGEAGRRARSLDYETTFKQTQMLVEGERGDKERDGPQVSKPIRAPMLSKQPSNDLCRNCQSFPSC